MALSFTVRGEPASGKNSRQIVYNKTLERSFLVLSKKAQRYVRDVKKQVRICEPLLTGELRFTATLYYATQRPDLDAELLIDALQGVVYKNDRQVREKHLFHAIDRNNPRAEVTIEAVQADLLQGAA